MTMAFGGCLVGAMLALPWHASAHLGMVSPESRYGPNVLKEGPCGQAGGARSDRVYVFAPGETIVLEWDEYVDHPGHFRISFDEDGDDDFVDPPCLAGCDGRSPTVEMYSNDTVLLDNIPDTAGGRTRIELTLPNVTCDNCTLQVLQVMYDKPPYTIPGNEMYYQCIDLILQDGSPAPVDAGLPPEMDAGSLPGPDGGDGPADASTPAPGVADAGVVPTTPLAAPGEPEDQAPSGAVIRSASCRCGPSHGFLSWWSVLVLFGGAFVRRRFF